MNKEIKLISEVYIDMLTEGKMLKTHLPSGKPNPNHPAYSKHKEAYDSDRAAEKAKVIKPVKQEEENPVKFHHIDDAIGNAYPDAEPYEHLARKFPHLHKAVGKNGSKLTDMADKTVRANTKYKSFSDYSDDVFKQHKADAAADQR
jgi:hypothetical protein